MPAPCGICAVFVPCDAAVLWAAGPQGEVLVEMAARLFMCLAAALRGGLPCCYFACRSLLSLSTFSTAVSHSLCSTHTHAHTHTHTHAHTHAPTHTHTAGCGLLPHGSNTQHLASAP